MTTPANDVVEVPVDYRLRYPGDLRNDVTVHVRAQHHIPGAGVQVPLERNGVPVFVDAFGYPLAVVDVTYDAELDRSTVELAIANPAVREALAS